MKNSKHLIMIRTKNDHEFDHSRLINFWRFFKANESDETASYDHVRDCIENEIGKFDLENESGLTWVRTVVYDMKCNWKVFVDNYLDGGYHVDVLHKDLVTML